MVASHTDPIRSIKARRYLVPTLLAQPALFTWQTGGLFAMEQILGFHMTSPKFKLRNYRFFRVSEFHEVLQHPNTFINITLILYEFFKR